MNSVRAGKDQWLGDIAQEYIAGLLVYVLSNPTDLTKNIIDLTGRQ